MSLTEAPITPDVLDDETQRTDAWTDMRDRERRVGTLPKGTYDAHIREVAVVRRRDDDSHVLRVIVRTLNLGRDGLAWQGLSSNPDDPFDLDDKQVKAVRKFADRLGIPTPCPAVDVVHALVEMQRAETVVQAKVTQTPVGQQIQLSRALNGEVLPATPRAADLEGAAEKAWHSHSKVVQGLQAVNLGLAHAAQGCYELDETEGWRALGFGTLNEYLASPEITISRSEFYRLAAIHREYVLIGGINPDRLQGAGPTKLEVPLPALGQGIVSVEEAVVDATTMPRHDLREKYAALQAGEEPSENGSGPSRRRDSQGASVPVDVARRLTFVLQRVLAEVGAPEQKRMGRELREALLEVLALAHEHALDVEADRC